MKLNARYSQFKAKIKSFKNVSIDWLKIKIVVIIIIIIVQSFDISTAYPLTQSTHNNN